MKQLNSSKFILLGIISLLSIHSNKAFETLEQEQCAQEEKVAVLATEENRSPRPTLPQGGHAGFTGWAVNLPNLTSLITKIVRSILATTPSSSSSSGNVHGPSSSTINAVPRFANTLGTQLNNSLVLVDDSGNITINGITKDSNTVNWPSNIGAAGTFLGSDGVGNLVYAIPVGGGNVSTALPFSTNNAILTTDLPSSVDNIKQSNVTLDGSNNINGVNSLTMVGNLNMELQAPVRFQDGTGGGNYVGLNAPATVGTSYTVNLPASAPTAGQVLEATSPSATQWATIGGPPSITEKYYVSLDGSNSNDGSFSAPFRTVSHAVSVANGVASLSNPVAIIIGAGIFAENNTGGPITITADGISIIGTSRASTSMVPFSQAIDLFHLATASVEFINFSLVMPFPGSTAAAVSLSANAGGAIMDTLLITGFQTGFAVSSPSGGASIVFENIECGGNATLISLDNMQAVIKNSLLQGPSAGATANTGIIVTGTNTKMAILSTAFNLFDTALLVNGGSDVRILGSDIEATTNGIICEGGSSLDVVGCNFLINNVNSINVTSSGANSTVTIEGSHFQGTDTTGNPQGTALKVMAGAAMAVDSCAIEGAVVAIQCGIPSDTNTTNLSASGAILQNCITDIQQNGSSTLNFFSGVVDLTKVTIANPTNVSFAAFNTEAELVIGTGADIEHTVYEIFNGQVPSQELVYQPNYYGNKGTVYVNPNVNPTFNATQAQSNNASYYVITGDRTKEASINLISDTGNFGVSDNIRGWGIDKVGTSANLAFTYTNNDTSSQAARGSNSVMQLDGFNNQVLFPVATNIPLPTNTVAQLVWAGDTNLYRSAADTLKTDSNFVVGSLTPAGVVHNDNSGLLSTSLIVNADISPSAAITDNKLATISTPGKVANSATTATSANTPNTIVLRDVTGSFSANIITATLVGGASLNVLKAGDTMTGNLNMALQSEVRFQDGTGSGNYVGLDAPATVPSSYTVSLPASAPITGQVLQTTSPGATQWAAVGGSPTVAKTYYVSLSGSDSNDGSFSAPFLTVSHAVSVANGVANLGNPVVISVGAGFFAENNTGGPITITADGISIVGSSISATNIVPFTSAIDLFHITTANVEIKDLSLVTPAPGSTANAVTLVGGASGTARFGSIAVGQFQTGFAVSSASGGPTVLFENVQCAGNGTNIAITNIQAVVSNSAFQGPLFTGPAANTGIVITGTNAQVAMFGNAFHSLDVAAVLVTGGAGLRILSSDIESTTTGILCTGGSSIGLIGCNFFINNANSVNVVASGANTEITLDGCQFHCTGTSGTPQGIALQSTAGALLLAVACSIENAAIGIQCGQIGDTSSTIVQANSTSFNGCTTDIQQIGSSTLRFVAGVFDANLLNIADPTNVSFAAFDNTSNSALTIGNDSDMTQLLFQVFNGQPSLPILNYESNYYGNKGTVYINTNTDASFNGLQSQNNASHYVITTDRTKDASINLLSDTSGTVGSGNNTRGWGIDKVGTSADLAFTYTNNDTSGQAARGSNSVMQLDGFNNQVLFPLATNIPLPTNTVAQLVWAGDTDLYRSAVSTLKTDSNFVVGSLTPAGVVHNDNTGLLSTSLIVNADISPSAAITDDKLATISTAGKVANSATTATSADIPNTIVLRDGLGNFVTHMITIDGVTTSSTDVATKSYVDAAVSTGFVVKNPAVVVSTTNVTLSGLQTIDGVPLSAGDRVLLVGQTNPIENGLWLDEVGAWLRPTDFASGTIAGEAYVLTLSGTINAGSSWVCTTSAAIIDTDPIEFAEFTLPSQTTGANVGAGTGQVFRDKTGVTLNFRTLLAGSHIIVTNNTDDITIATDGTTANTPSTLVARDGLGDFSAGTITASLNGNATSATNFTGALVGDVTGTQGATVVSTVGGQTAANVASGAVAANAATDTNTANTIVKRDASGNFVASTITANLTGNVTGNLSGNATTATTAGSATNFTGSLSGDVTGNQNSTAVSSVGGQTAASVASATVLANAATSNNTASAIVRRDASGNFSAGTITANLSGNATTATSATTAGSATNFTGSLAGDVTGTQGATVVSFVGGQSAANVAAATTLANTATSNNVANTVVLRDASGNFSASTITASLNGNATTATTAGSATNFSGSLAGDVTGIQAATVVSFVGGQSAANVASGAVAANAATNTNTANTIVKRDASGNFAAGTITANLTGNVTGNLSGNATSATTAGSATNFTGSLSGDVTGNQNSTVVSSVGGQTAANVAAATVLANAATSNNTASTIVRRDASGNFSAGTITASLTGAASLNVLKAGDTMTGSLTLPAGTVASPSLQFSGSSNTGLSAPIANTLSISTNATQRLNIDTTGSVMYKSNYKMYAYRSTNQSINNTTATIIFNTELLDPNANYNNATGVYTVPVTGTYMINVTVTSQTSSRPANETVNIVRNGSAVTGASVSQKINTSNAAQAMTTCALLSLTAGDLIRIDYTTNKSDTVIANDTHIAIHYMSF